MSSTVRLATPSKTFSWLGAGNPGVRQLFPRKRKFRTSAEKLYEFRVLTGLQKPIFLSEIKLPEIDGPECKTVADPTPHSKNALQQVLQ